MRISSASAVWETTVARTWRRRSSAASRADTAEAGSRYARASSPTPGITPTNTTFRLCSSIQRSSASALRPATASRRSYTDVVRSLVARA
jgi:hypothetical protein